MSFVIGFLMFLLIVDCFLLILLVLVQLPKKEAGAGLAFGGGASDALFGAGGGNALTKLTKWVATAFFVLSMGISILMSHFHNRSVTGLEEELSKQTVPTATTPSPTLSNQTSVITPLDTNAPLRIPLVTNSQSEASNSTAEPVAEPTTEQGTEQSNN